MGSRERRERERADTRGRILDAAREMFVDHGYDATTMRAIAQRIEYTPTAIYHHFQNKEALLTELCAVDFRALARVFQRIGRVSDPVERLDRIGQAYVEYAQKNPMHYRFMFMAVRPPLPPEAQPGIRHGDPGEDAYAFLRQACADAIAENRFRPEFDDPDEVAQMLWSGMHGIVSLQIAKAHDEWIAWRDVERTAARIRETMVRGLLRTAV
jgi:AcrR family transcriptional regulator